MTLRYVCEICGSIYQTPELAKMCESFVMPPQKFKVGDTVYLRTRYSGVKSSPVMEGPRLGANDYNTWISKDVDKYRLDNWEFHHRAYKLDDSYQFSKDENGWAEWWQEYALYSTQKEAEGKD